MMDLPSVNVGAVDIFVAIVATRCSVEGIDDLIVSSAICSVQLRYSPSSRSDVYVWRLTASWVSDRVSATPKPSEIWRTCVSSDGFSA